MAPILQTKRLTKRFGKLVAVNDLSFEVEEGMIFGIAGPNGAGKTTLFNLLTGVYSGEGEIYLAGQPIQGKRPHQVARLGLARTFQIPTVFNTLSVFDNIRVAAYFGNSKPHGKDTITKVLDFTGLRECAHDKVEHLSLFNKKMTMLAAALATHPKLLLLDEPIAGLSPIEIERSVSLFKRINQELNITLIVIEHLMKVLVDISWQMMILNDGKDIATGLPETVTQDKQVIEVYLGS